MFLGIKYEPLLDPSPPPPLVIIISEWGPGVDTVTETRLVLSSLKYVERPLISISYLLYQILGVIVKLSDLDPIQTKLSVTE